MNALQHSLETVQITATPRRPAMGSVESWDAREDQHTQMKDSGFGSFLAGLVIGGLVGAAIGLLLAPQAGEELREQVGDFVDTQRAAFGEAISEGRAAAEKARAEMIAEYEAPGAGGQPEGAAS